MSEPSDLQLIDFFKTVFATYDKNGDGTIDTTELGLVLRALGREASEEKLTELIEEFDVDHNGKLDWTNGEFLMVVAAIDVVDVNLIDDLVFSAAFRTFDQDANGQITPLEMHIVVGLFLPMELKEQDDFVEDLIRKMDTNRDGKIGYSEFVKFVKEAGTASILSI
eukprot:TRINITY_DN13775_c0_g1_i2.p2 TRINITY_DN13775_c0_g1~~TRINITY_DN13775_c0_g1_i2.p2  ORF type:complete len:166 (-),score=56.96 TRINITY_DN13775_c0_g1_i2:84-581(-)